MSQLTVYSELHRRLSRFLRWIIPDPDKKEENSVKAELLRKCVKQNAQDDGLEVASMPRGGSDEKDTGLRRHYLGHSEVDGYDIDVPIVTKRKGKDDDKIDNLLKKFEKYVRKSYPDSKIKVTNSSVNLILSNDLSFDVVPMISTDKADEQLIIKKDG